MIPITKKYKLDRNGFYVNGTQVIWFKYWFWWKRQNKGLIWRRFLLRKLCPDSPDVVICRGCGVLGRFPVSPWKTRYEMGLSLSPHEDFDFPVGKKYYCCKCQKLLHDTN